MRDENELEG